MNFRSLSRNEVGKMVAEIGVKNNQVCYNYYYDPLVKKFVCHKSYYATTEQLESRLGTEIKNGVSRIVRFGNDGDRYTATIHPIYVCYTHRPNTYRVQKSVLQEECHDGYYFETTNNVTLKERNDSKARDIIFQHMMGEMQNRNLIANQMLFAPSENIDFQVTENE